MQINMSQKNESNSAVRRTPEEVRRILSYTLEDAKKDDEDRVVNDITDVAVSIAEKQLEDDEKFHARCDVMLDNKAVELCHQVIRRMKMKGGDIACCLDSTYRDCIVMIGATFKDTVTFEDDIKWLSSMIDKSEFGIHINCDNPDCEMLVTFHITVGKYVETNNT